MHASLVHITRDKATSNASTTASERKIADTLASIKYFISKKSLFQKLINKKAQWSTKHKAKTYKQYTSCKLKFAITAL